MNVCSPEKSSDLKKKGRGREGELFSKEATHRYRGRCFCENKVMQKAVGGCVEGMRSQRGKKSGEKGDPAPDMLMTVANLMFPVGGCGHSRMASRERKGKEKDKKNIFAGAPARLWGGGGRELTGRGENQKWGGNAIAILPTAGRGKQAEIS